MQDVKKVVLAYSGGLDTSVILKWLIETYHCEVIAVTADLGQPEDLSGVEAKALKTGASKAYVLDLREEMAKDFVFPMDSAGLCTLLEETQPGPGRLVLLHRGELDGVAGAARALELPCYEERRSPVLCLPKPEAFDLETLAFAQAEALDAALDTSLRLTPDATYLAPVAALGHCRERRTGPFPYSGAPAFTPGCEGFWLHPGLTPDFFRVQRQAFGLL